MKYVGDNGEKANIDIRPTSGQEISLYMLNFRFI